MKQVYFFASVIISIFLFESCLDARPSAEYENFIQPSNINEGNDLELVYDFSQNETFESFIKKFSADSLFQVNRIEFPLRQVRLSDDFEEMVAWIEEKEWWRFVLENTEEYTMNFFELEKEGISIGYVAVKGIENGINITYSFEIKEGMWYLTKVEDLST